MEAVIPKPTPLTPAEIAGFQAMVKPAIVLLLMMRLARPAGARELGDILGLDEHTVAKYLRILAKLNLVRRTRHRSGYQLVIDPQGLIDSALTVNKLQLRSTTNTKELNNIQNKPLTAVTALADQQTNVSAPAPQENLHALRALGIGEPKRTALAKLAHVTPACIQAWHAHLAYAKGEDYRPGLLIHVLETGDPAPDVNENGHPKHCTCSQCSPLICLDCHVYPCDCS
jgi:predicted transcriptional regulator